MCVRGLSRQGPDPGLPRLKDGPVGLLPWDLWSVVKDTGSSSWTLSPTPSPSMSRTRNPHRNPLTVEFGSPLEKEEGGVVTERPSDSGHSLGPCPTVWPLPTLFCD